jgi:hypothetical protein
MFCYVLSYTSKPLSLLEKRILIEGAPRYLFGHSIIKAYLYKKEKKIRKKLFNKEKYRNDDTQNMTTLNAAQICSSCNVHLRNRALPCGHVSLCVVIV